VCSSDLWQRGDRLVPPNDFIPLAEETNLIVKMSRWAIHEALRQVKEWQETFGFTGTVAVNMPSRMFDRSIRRAGHEYEGNALKLGDNDIPLDQFIDQTVKQIGVPHNCIELEITETGLMADLQSVIPTLASLTAMGAEISVDDFGTGYSSLAYLTTLPISEVKIDRRFVRDLGSNQESFAVVEAIIALARSLRKRVVAEGVETSRQLDTLLRAGCSVMQGFYFSKPLPAAELAAWAQRPMEQFPWRVRTQAEFDAGSKSKALGRV
jgi:EAL domain-containing protein (putative c-di-GMP-specific phosphodiesterase class I)